jgi:hypothetical protein
VPNWRNTLDWFAIEAVTDSLPVKKVANFKPAFARMKVHATMMAIYSDPKIAHASENPVVLSNPAETRTQTQRPNPPVRHSLHNPFRGTGLLSQIQSLQSANDENHLQTSSKQPH